MIVIPINVFEEMVAAGLKRRPAEACGLLYGTAPNVEGFKEMKNVETRLHHYAMHPDEMKKFFESYKLVGIFHTHVDSDAKPSVKDLDMAFYPGVSYIILSLKGPEPVLKSYKILSAEKYVEESVNFG